LNYFVEFIHVQPGSGGWRPQASTHVFAFDCKRVIATKPIEYTL
jgi:hypothetical protein